MKLIDKSALVAEIEKLESRFQNWSDEDYADGYHYSLKLLKRSLNSLEVKEVDLDYIKDELDRVVKIYKPDGDFGWGTLYNIATHFFELGLKVQKGE